MASLVFALSEEPKQVQEEVDDVQVQRESCEDVVVDAELKLMTAHLSQDHLRVKDDVHDEEHDAAQVVHNHDLRNVDAAHTHNPDGQTEKAEGHQSTKEIRPHACEVRLCDARIAGETQEDSRSDADTEGHTTCCILCRDKANQDALKDCEAKQE